MSVTFHAALNHSDQIGWDLWCDGTESYTFYPDLSWEEIQTHMQAPDGVWPCCDREWHPSSAKWDPRIADESLNMANSNARRLLEVLGLVSDDLCGSADADDVYGRILVARAFASGDVGRPGFTEVGPNGATLVDPGVPEGYLDRKLDDLQRVVEHCQRIDRRVSWG